MYDISLRFDSDPRCYPYIRTLLSSSIYFVNQNQQFYNTIASDISIYACKKAKKKKNRWK